MTDLLLIALAVWHMLGARAVYVALVATRSARPGVLTFASVLLTWPVAVLAGVARS